MKCDNVCSWSALTNNEKEKTLAIMATLENERIARAMWLLEVCKELLLQTTIPENHGI